MKFIKSIAKNCIDVIKKYKYNYNYIKEDKNKKILGRWNIESCSKKIDTKIDLSNEDHCGPCGLYMENKLKIRNDATMNENKK